MPKPKPVLVLGEYDSKTRTLTYTCPGCGKQRTHRGRAFAGGVIALCGCGFQSSVHTE